MRAALVLLASLICAPAPAFADRALPTWEAYRAAKELDVAAEAWARGEVRAAEVAAAEAVRLTPDRAEAWHILALARLALGRFEAAVETAAPLARLAPDDVDACLLRGRIGVESGDVRAARDAFDQAARIAPEDPRAALGRALVFARLEGDMEGMAIHLREARVLDPAQPDATLPLRAAWAPLAEDEGFLKALQTVLEER
jgi:tetratricopeptide (TPR) repeat protein